MVFTAFSSDIPRRRVGGAEMRDTPYRTAVIGCGSHGEYIARGYAAFPETEIVAIVEHNPDRLRVMGERFGVRALYPDVDSLLKDMLPELAVIVTPSRYYKEIVVACAEAGVKGISTDKPMAAVLSDADEMVDICRKRGIVYSGGIMQHAHHAVQEAARRIRSGMYGEFTGACVHRLGSEISGGGCQAISVPRLLAGEEIDEVMTWVSPDGDIDADMLTPDRDVGWVFRGRFHLSSGVDCPVFGSSKGGLDVWSDSVMIRWDWEPPVIYEGFLPDGTRRRIDPGYEPAPWSEFVSPLSGSVYSFLEAVDTGTDPWVSGHDMRQALEVAIACVQSARMGSVPVKLPLEDRSLKLYPSPYRWQGGDVAGRPRRF